MNLVVDTGVFSASLSTRARPTFDAHLNLLPGNQIYLAAVTVAELRYGALVAHWGDVRRLRLERAIETTTVIPVSDALLTTLATLRFECRRVGHPLADPIHANDLWIAASAVHIDATLITADIVFNDVPGLSVSPRNT